MTDDEYTSFTGCFPKVLNSWHQLLSSVNLRHPIHPLDPIAPEQSEFFIIDTKTRIRVIHGKPEKGAGRHDVNFKRNSHSEEYWFAKCNKPIKIVNCNCSFRRSQRLSVLSSQSLNGNRESIASFEAAPKHITNVESFVERIIQETILEAFHEYFVVTSRNHGNGAVNLAYEKGDDEEDGVVLRRKFLSTPVVNKQPKRYSITHKNPCLHKAHSHKKPIIILFHGIGNSAEVWSLIIDAMTKKGFEVVAPDMLGHGYSSAPNSASAYTFHNLLIHAIHIFDHYVGPDEKRKSILIGHSYGCSIMSALYRHRSSQISQLVLISGGGPTPLAAPVGENEISPFGCVHTLFQPLLFCGLKRSFLFSSRGKHFESCELETAIPGQILDNISKGQNWPEGDAAYHRRILVPTLLVHGLQDKQVTLVQQCEMERTIPRAFLELIPNAGHMAMLETPEHLSHMILCFIDTWS